MYASRLVQWIGGVPALNGLLRRCAAQYEDGSVVRIKTGLAAGLLWKRHHRYVNGYWLGHYELEIQKALQRELKSGDTFFDVGANAGFFALIGARLVGPSGSCVAFDPSPENVRTIREQLELNGLTQYCTCVEQAVGSHEGRSLFAFATPGSPLGHLGATQGAEQQIEVAVTTLDEACSRFGPPDLIKLDIEGGEVDVFQSTACTLSKLRTSWLIELHGEECEQVVKRRLQEENYGFFSLDGNALTSKVPLPKHFIARARDMQKQIGLTS